MLRLYTLERTDYLKEATQPQDLFQHKEMKRRQTKNYIRDLNELVAERQKEIMNMDPQETMFANPDDSIFN